MVNLVELERIAREEFADIVVDVYRIDAKLRVRFRRSILNLTAVVSEGILSTSICLLAGGFEIAGLYEFPALIQFTSAAARGSLGASKANDAAEKHPPTRLEDLFHHRRNHTHQRSRCAEFSPR